MRFKLLILLLLCTGFCDLAAQRSVISKLENLEKERFEAMTEKNTDALEEMLDDDLTYGHSNGLMENKKQHLENIRSGYIVYAAITPVQMEVKKYRKSAVINGLIRVEGSYRGDSFDIQLRYMDVYVKYRDGWKLAAWQSVKVE